MRTDTHIFRLLFLLLALADSNSNAHAQADGIRAGTDTAGIIQMIRAADKTLNPDSAIMIYDKALQLSVAGNFADGAKTALMTKGIKYSEKEDYEQSRKCYKEAYPWCLKSTDKQAVAWYYNNMGSTYFHEADYIKATENYYTALQELKKATQSPTRMAVNIYNNLGLINQRLDQEDKAISYFRQAERLAEQGQFEYQRAIVLMNEGEYFKNNKQPDSAKTYFTTVMGIAQKIGRVDLQAGANLDLGKTFIATEDYAKAIPLLHLAISLAENHFPYIVMDASYSLGNALYHTGKYNEARTILEAALTETKAHNNKNTYITCYNNLINVYEALGLYKKALDCKDSVMVLKDSLMNSEKAEAINRMEIKFKTEEKDKQLAQNELLIAQQKNKIAAKNIWIVSIASSIILLSLLLAVLVGRARNRQRLQAEQIKALQQSNTISILKGTVQGEEKERSRIARELHDGIGGILSSAMMRLMSIKHENAEITKVPAYGEAMDLLDQMGDEIRKTAHNLMPEVLLKQPLEEAIRVHCNHLQQSTSLQVDFQSYGSFDAITRNTKLNIYRIVQELLKNITKHAQATKALVQLMINEHTLTVTVEDNGTGFNADEVKNGIGIHNVQTRVNSMNGHLTIDSTPAKGTSVYIEFDLMKMSANETA